MDPKFFVVQWHDHCRSPEGRISVVYKLITIVAAAIPIILLLKGLFGRSKAMKLALSDFRQQIDYLVWMILFVIGCGIVYAVGKLTYSLWN